MIPVDKVLLCAYNILDLEGCPYYANEIILISRTSAICLFLSSQATTWKHIPNLNFKHVLYLM